MSTHKNIDLICVAVLVCTVLLTVLFVNGSRFGIKPMTDGDAENSSDSPYFTSNDRNDGWNSARATRITLSGDGASVSGGGAYACDGGAVIAQAGRYVISGTLDDGSIVVNTDGRAKVWILLDGVDIYCSDNACLRVDQADKVFLTLAEGSENRMESGAEYSDSALADNTGGAVYSHDDLTVNGSGSLSVKAACKHGVDVNDKLVIAGGALTVDAAGDALHVNDGLYIENAALHLRAGDEGIELRNTEALLYVASGSIDAESTGACVRSAGDILLEGGTFALSSEADGLHSGGRFELRDGALAVTAGDDGVNSEAGITLGGGTLRISAEGDGAHCAGLFRLEDGELCISAGDDGIHADGAAEFAGGRLLIEKCYEGIEALTIDISGGSMEIYPSDDGLNANGGSGFGFGMPMRQETTGKDAGSETWIHISGGSVAVVNPNARDADGLDSNGDILISGGTIRVSLSGGGTNNAIDYGSESGGVCEISGGEIVACGSYMMAEGFSSGSSQCGILYNIADGAAAGTTVSLEDADGKVLLQYEVPCGFSSVAMSSPEMKLGETYLVVIGGKAEEITLEEVSASYGDVQSGGFGGRMNWGGMQPRGEGGGRPEGMGGGPGRPGEADMPAPPEGSDVPVPPEGFDMPAPPEGSDVPQFPEINRGEGERPALPEGSDMPAITEGSDAPQPAGHDGGEQESEELSDTAQSPEEERVEITAPGPQPVGRETWLLIGACVLVLAAGILFGMKYKV